MSSLPIGLWLAPCAVQGAVSAEVEVALPRYDKSQHGGRGDRAPHGSWPRVQGPIDIILFEGWMLGFSPVAEADVSQVCPFQWLTSRAWLALKDLCSRVGVLMTVAWYSAC